MEKKRPGLVFLLVIISCIILIMILLSLFNSRKKSIQVNGNNREYLIHTPLLKNSEKMPLVIALHGYTDNPRLMEFYSGFSRKSEKEKFVVVYPYGTKNEKDKNLSWNAGSCCGNGVLKDIDDVTFINALTDELIKNNNIDPKRIFLVGFSNGGLLVHRIASETPSRYKGVAVVSGTIGGKVYKELDPYVVSDPKKPISILMMHGQIDTRIPYLGGLNNNKDGDFKSFKESSNLWIKNNKCEGMIEAREKNVIKQVFENCSLDGKIELYSIKDGGHIWFGSIFDLIKNKKLSNISSTDTIWNFFNKL